jgi:hypothetical protein
VIKQLSLFDPATPKMPIKPCDPKVGDVAKPRLSRQCRLILERLRRGPATNSELSGIALKYTNRISELRMAGYVIPCFDHNRKTGLAYYRLDFDPGTNDHT